MPDVYKEVTRRGFGSRIMGSIKGIFIGIILFLASFAVLYWNEGRVDVSDIAKESVEVEATQLAGAEMDGQFISTTGTVATEETLGDGMYLLPGDYLAVERRVEMYAWVEKSESESEKNLGGSETTETTYSYSKQWVENPSDSSSFKISEGHENPAKTIDSASKTVSTAKIGVYTLDMSKVALPGFDRLPLNEEMIDFESSDIVTGAPAAQDIPSGTTTTTTETTESTNGNTFTTTTTTTESTMSDGFAISTEETTTETTGDVPVGPADRNLSSEVLVGDYVFIGKGTFNTPEVGDMRVSYHVLKNGVNATVFGKLNGDQINTYVDEGTDTSVYRMFSGTRDEALAQMHTEYVMMLWIFRIIGFLMMWIGLSSVFGPISVLLDIIPAIGSISRSFIGFITFIVSAILSIVTVIISMILHNIIAVIVSVVVVLGILFYLMRKKVIKPKIKPAKA